MGSQEEAGVGDTELLVRQPFSVVFVRLQSDIEKIGEHSIRSTPDFG